jgi:hypothetical protein
VAAGAGAQMLDTPAVVGSHKVVSLQGGFVGVES